MRRYGMEDWQTAFIPFSQQSYDDLYREFIDAKIRQGDSQDLARFKRKINISGHIASAATTFAAISSEDGKLAPQSKTAVGINLTFNQDGVSLLQKDDKKKKSMRTTKKARNVGRSTGFGAKVLSQPALNKLNESQNSKKKKTQQGSRLSLNSNDSSSCNSSLNRDPVELNPRLSNESTVSGLSEDSFSVATSESEILSRIRRDNDVTKPIVCTRSSLKPGKYPPLHRSQAKRGSHFDIISHGKGQWLAAIFPSGVPGLRVMRLQ